MSLTSHNDTLRMTARENERRRSPRYEALGPGEIRATSGETLGSVRLIDESEGGLACATGVEVEIGQILDVRIGGAAQTWRHAVVISTLDCGGALRRLGLMFQRPLAARQAA